MSAMKISVVTPSFGQANFLRQTIQSVLAQDYPHVEYIVMDGGSTDGSVEILRECSEQLSYWTSEKDKGQSDAIARGFERSTGEIMGWLNSDDLLLPGALTAVAEFFRENPDVEVVSGGAYCIDAEGQPLRGRFGNYSLGVAATHRRLRYYHLDGVFQQATFWRRSAYDAVGGIDRSLKFIMDRDLFMRLAARRRFARLPRMLACFRVHEDCKILRIQHVREEESRTYYQRYGAYRFGSLVRNILFYRYRLTSMIRKLWLSVLLNCRNIRLERVP